MAEARLKWVKYKRSDQPDLTFYLPKHDPRLTEPLWKPPELEACDRPCTKKIELFPKREVEGHTGYGYFMVNVDGYRCLNCYLISDPLSSTNQRGFTLEISFALEPFQQGVGYYGETEVFFNAEGYYDPGNNEHALIRIRTSDLMSTGGLPWIGGQNLAHILRVPVMGPFVRASVFNKNSQKRSARVVAYATT
jgi:hypothetical protein